MNRIVVTGTRGIPNMQGGIETHCEELFPRIAEKGFHITVVRRKNFIKDQLTTYKGVFLYDLSNLKKKSLETIVHTFRAIWFAKWKLNADIIHIHAIGPAILSPIARLFNMKVVFTHHGSDYERTKWGKTAKFILRMGERLGCKFANEVIVISNVINEHIKQKYKRSDANLIYNGVPAPVMVNDTSYLQVIGVESQKYIFAAGRFVPEKNFHTLIAAFALLHQTDVKLVIAGDADIEDNYSKALKQMAIKNGVILTGFVKGIRLQTLFTHAKFFVLPSLHEGLPIALLEAMSYHLPVIVSDIPATHTVDLPEDCYFSLNDENALFELLHKKLSSDLSPVSYNLEKYNWDTIAEKTAQIYKSLLK